MTLYVVKNDEGKYWDDAEGRWTTTACDCWDSKESADEAASELHSRVVPLVEEPAPVVVSEDEAEMLEKAKNITEWRPAAVIAGYAYDTMKDADGETLLEDRLLRAYTNGGVVEKHKLWNVKVPHVAHYVYRVDDGELNIEPDSVGSLGAQFTTAEIEHYGLTHCEKVEVSNKGERNE